MSVEGAVATQMLDEPVSLLLVEMDQHLGVTVGTEYVPARL